MKRNPGNENEYEYDTKNFKYSVERLEPIQNISSLNISPQNLIKQNLSTTKLIKQQNLSNHKTYQTTKLIKLQNLSNYKPYQTTKLI